MRTAYLTKPFSRSRPSFKYPVALASFVLMLTATTSGKGPLLVSQGIDSAVGVGYFSYDNRDVFEIPVGDPPYGTALTVAVDLFHSFYFTSSITGEVYTLDDLVVNGAFFSPEFPVVTGQPLPKIPRFGIREAATFANPNSTVLELFFDVVTENVNGARVGESHYSVPEPASILLFGIGVCTLLRRRQRRNPDAQGTSRSRT